MQKLPSKYEGVFTQNFHYVWNQSSTVKAVWTRTFKLMLVGQHFTAHMMGLMELTTSYVP